ncbi:MAG TPA: carbamoyltransferase C-terminal domain-containing protein [Gammaproteobacteria bacterium]|nr:carbamoyltransferase C-terminal domain-containing protein [Gammaproteobacteria bacterium]
MYTLGINAAFHDCSACLVADGVVLAAAEEERFTEVKHGKRPVPFTTWQLPFHAIDFCLAEAGIALREVDHIAYAYDPTVLLHDTLPTAEITLPLTPSAHGKDNPWLPLFLAYVVNAPRQLAGGAPHHLAARFRDVAYDGPYAWHWVEHHLAHEASAFLAAPFDECAVLTIDGQGEKTTTSFGVFAGGNYRRLKQIALPHSLGLLYEDVTRHLGFLHSSDEYKVMALASFGAPRYLDEFRHVVQRDAHGGYRIVRGDMSDWLGPPRLRGGPLEPHHYDIARSLQAVLEETALGMAFWLQRETGQRKLALAGGVSLNCVMNARLRDDGPFEEVWVQPAAGDAGTALGAALWIDYQQRGRPPRRWRMEHAYLGPAYTDTEIEDFLRWSKLPYRRLGDVAAETAGLLANGAIIGWFQGRMEFGPRALGARSILASPLAADMQARLNEIKDREDFRPVAPVVLEEAAADWFVGARPAPFMLFTFDVRPERAARIPAVTHVDGTARVQTVNARQHPLYHRLIREFAALTGVPVLVNTSFNTRGQPIVCTPRHAVECFWTSPLDALVIGSFLLEKDARPRRSAASHGRWATAEQER